MHTVESTSTQFVRYVVAQSEVWHWPERGNGGYGARGGIGGGRSGEGGGGEGGGVASCVYTLILAISQYASLNPHGVSIA